MIDHSGRSTQAAAWTPTAGSAALVLLLTGITSIRPALMAADPPAPLELTAAPPLRPLHAAASQPSRDIASYAIDVRLDPEAKTLAGREVLSWRNTTTLPATELRFHLYWNAWRNDRSTWMREDRLGARSNNGGRSDLGEKIRDEDWGWQQVESIRLLDPAGETIEDLTPAQRFDAPEDGNLDDRTVLVVPLATPVPPGGSTRVEIVWRARIPRTFARTGRRGDFYFLAHWFPGVGVFRESGWDCHQFHAATEFFSDFGSYDVRITVPERFVVGATGRLDGSTPNGDGTVTYRHRQDDVHTFTWTASPDYVEHRERFELAGLPPIEMRLLLQPEHAAQAERHFLGARATFEHYGRWFGPYPYGHVTIIDPAYGSGAGGMEYPTLFTSGTRLFNPPEGDQPESVTIHEAGHQFWYGMVANDEFEHAWLDEGINTYSQLRTMEEALPESRLVRRYLPPPGSKNERDGFLPWVFRDVPASRWADRRDRYRPAATADRPDRATFLYYTPEAANITYSKVALTLRTLERHLGWETMQRILAAFFERYRFRHPEPEDFFAVANEVSGQDLTWFFDQTFRRSEAFDYAVASVASASTAPRGYLEPGAAVNPEAALALAPSGTDGDDTPPFRTEVVVRRLGGGVFPIDVLLVFEDGSEYRERWDGQERWTSIVVERPVKLRHAIVDPERILMLDLDFTNNSRLLEPGSKLPAAKWASRWMLWFQDLLQTFAFFA